MLLRRSATACARNISPAIFPAIWQIQFRSNVATPRVTRNMANITPVFSAAAFPPAGPYSQAVRAGSQIYVSGQIPANQTGTLVQGSIADKTEACIKNITAILKAAGVGLESVVKVNVFLTDMANFAEMNATYAKHFVTKPARSCVAVKQLPMGVDVEIECIALS
ncbi:MAG: hypothetical protein M1838_003292 [Thelocarpon superellum]|nr:MAG: hypothetical protein M1838_003292 [Thelocarpon superellum]